MSVSLSLAAALEKKGIKLVPSSIAQKGEGGGGGDRETWSFWGGRGGDTGGKGPGLLWRQACAWRQLFKETRVEEAALPGEHV